MSAGGLALAKIGEPAVPAIAERLRVILQDNSGRDAADAAGLIDVLRAIGPSAVPTLVATAESGSRWAPSALDAIVRIEGRTWMGRSEPGPWSSWKLPDASDAALERAMVPLVPRIEKLMNRAMSDRDMRRTGSIP